MAMILITLPIMVLSFTLLQQKTMTVEKCAKCFDTTGWAPGITSGPQQRE